MIFVVKTSIITQCINKTVITEVQKLQKLFFVPFSLNTCIDCSIYDIKLEFNVVNLSFK